MHESHMTCLQIDFKNAFNLASRQYIMDIVRTDFSSIFNLVQWSCTEKFMLCLKDRDSLFSSIGVQQGDPLGPFLFSIVLHKIVTKIQKETPLKLNGWFMDDGVCIGRPENVREAGSHLNMRKCVIKGKRGANDKLGAAKARVVEKNKKYARQRENCGFLTYRIRKSWCN